MMKVTNLRGTRAIAGVETQPEIFLFRCFVLLVNWGSSLKEKRLLLRGNQILYLVSIKETGLYCKAYPETFFPSTLKFTLIFLRVGESCEMKFEQLQCSYE